MFGSVFKKKNASTCLLKMSFSQLMVWLSGLGCWFGFIGIPENERDATPKKNPPTENAKRRRPLFISIRRCQVESKVDEVSEEAPPFSELWFLGFEICR